MRQSVLPVLLLTTVTLSLSDVFPISVDQTDAEPNSDQEYDNTLNSVQNDRNIFYELFKGPSERETSTKSRRKYKLNPVRASNDELRRNDNYDDKGFRNEQWHNYPRQLDRLHRSSYEYPEFENIPTDYDYNEKRKRDDDLQEINNEDVLDSTNIDDVAGPLFILKIRLAFLNNNMKNMKSNNNDYTNSIQLDPTDLNKLYTEIDEKDKKLLTNKINSIVHTKRARGGTLRKKEMTYLEIDPAEKKTVNKRIFSLWSRLQSLSHKGHQLHNRRHLYTFYGLPDKSSTLTAETRALVRPPGSPLRWG